MFIDQFIKPYYKLKFDKKTICNIRHTKNGWDTWEPLPKPVLHACNCPQEQSQFYMVIKELKANNYDVNKLPLPSYYTNNNGIGKAKDTILFYDIRKCTTKC